jgi:hypothetical protein
VQRGANQNAPQRIGIQTVGCSRSSALPRKRITSRAEEFGHRHRRLGARRDRRRPAPGEGEHPGGDPGPPARPPAAGRGGEGVVRGGVLEDFADAVERRRVAGAQRMARELRGSTPAPSARRLTISATDWCESRWSVSVSPRRICRNTGPRCIPAVCSQARSARTAQRSFPARVRHRHGGLLPLVLVGLGASNQRLRGDHRPVGRRGRMGRHAGVRAPLRADSRRPRAPQNSGQADGRRRLEARQRQAPALHRGLQTGMGALQSGIVGE